MSTTEWLLVLGLALVIWTVTMRRLEARGSLDRWNATLALGFILMVRTKRGQATLECLSSPRRTMRALGEIGLWTCRATMALVILILVATLLVSLLVGSPEAAPQPLTLVGVPGINPIIPLGWGVVAFVIALVIHEFGHGIQARAHGMRVRSFGLLLLGPLPLGAFAEPEYEELMRAPRRERQRMFAAGPATNIYAAALCFLLLALAASQLVAAQPGVHAQAIVSEAPAASAGLAPYEIITHIDGEPLSEPSDLSTALDAHRAGDQVTLTVVNSSQPTREITLTLTDHHAWLIDHDVTEEQLKSLDPPILPGDAFLGVAGMASGTAGVDRLVGPYGGSDTEHPVIRTLELLIHPIVLLRVPFDTQGTAILEPHLDMLAAGDGLIAGLLGTAGLVFVVKLMFWLVWVNMLLGFTNLIPMAPFDGGHMFRDRIHDWVSGVDRIGRRLKKWQWHPMRIERFVQRASGLVSLGVLFVVIISMATLYIPL